MVIENMTHPVISYDIGANTWDIRIGGSFEGGLTAQQLAERYGIKNPIMYCQDQYKRLSIRQSA